MVKITVYPDRGGLEGCTQCGDRTLWTSLEAYTVTYPVYYVCQ